MKFELRGNPQVHIQESPVDRQSHLVGIMVPITLRFDLDKQALKDLADKMGSAILKVIKEENDKELEINL